MNYEELTMGMKVTDSCCVGTIEKIYKKTVHVRWRLYSWLRTPCNEVVIYDLEHLQFLKETT